MFHATELIRDAFIRDGLSAELLDGVDKEHISSVDIPMPVSGAGIQELRYISHDNDNDVSVRLHRLVSDVPEDRKDAMLRAINECNNRWRFAKFVMDNDGDVNVEYDLLVSTPDECLGEDAKELLARVHEILQSAYPILMRALWA